MNGTQRQMIDYLKKREANLYEDLKLAREKNGGDSQGTLYLLAKWGEINDIMLDFQITPFTSEQRQTLFSK